MIRCIYHCETRNLIATSSQHSSSCARTGPAEMRCQMLMLLLAQGIAQQGKISIPVQVDQAGHTLDFVVDDSSDILLEAEHFCKTIAEVWKKSVYVDQHTQEQCEAHLIHSVKTQRDARQKAQDSLPGLSFTVTRGDGEQLRFVHEEGANPADEAAAFCAEHFAEVAQEACVESMLRNAQKAYEEVTRKSEL